MGRDRFKVLVKGLVTCDGDVLVGKKEKREGHPISGKWHIPGGHAELEEQPEEAVVRELNEETGLSVDVHQIVDVHTGYGIDETVSILFHCEASSKNATAQDDLAEVKWVDPQDLKEKVHDDEQERLEKRENQSKFLDKLEKMSHML